MAVTSWAVVFIVAAAITFIQAQSKQCSEENCGNGTTNLKNVSTNFDNISTNIGNINLNMGNITNNKGLVGTNMGNITKNLGNISGNMGHVTNNQGNVSTNFGNITTNQRNVSGNLGSIMTNLGYISSNMGNVTQNDGNITNNINNVTTNLGYIGTNLGGVDTNMGNISINFGYINVNRGSVKTNFGTIIADLGSVMVNLGHKRNINGGHIAHEKKYQSTKENSSFPTSSIITQSPRQQKSSTILTSTSASPLNITGGITQTPKKFNRGTYYPEISSTRSVSPSNVTVKANNYQVLNLSGLNYNGSQVKYVLNGMDGSALDRIRVLDLSHNNITDLPNFWLPVNLEYGLRDLHLAHNNLSFNRRTLFELSRLQNLDLLNLSSVRWKDDELKALYLPHLHHLDLSHNNLTYLPDLRGLTFLTTLDLTGNSVPYPLASRIPQTLRILNLSHNKITRIPETYEDDCWHSNIHLAKLDVSYNSLKDPLHLNKLHVGEIQVGGNPWVCSCLLLTTMSIKNIVDKNNVTCTLDGVVYRWPMKDLPAQFLQKCVRKTNWRYSLLAKEQLFYNYNKYMSSALLTYIRVMYHEHFTILVIWAVLATCVVAAVAWLVWRLVHCRRGEQEELRPIRQRIRDKFSSDELPYTELQI